MARLCLIHCRMHIFTIFFLAPAAEAKLGRYDTRPAQICQTFGMAAANMEKQKPSPQKSHITAKLRKLA
ncbi:MAG: hypothetical protein JXB29_11325 [Sedimentisphaerales bacterium]|nr:hypothetical protein [Sedimentisphaerales bacterium]